MKVKVNDTVDLPIDLTNIVTATSEEEKSVSENNTDEDTNILAVYDLEKRVDPTSANTGGTREEVWYPSSSRHTDVWASRLSRSSAAGRLTTRTCAQPDRPWPAGPT